jgi:serine protease Do
LAILAIGNFQRSFAAPLPMLSGSSPDAGAALGPGGLPDMAAIAARFGPAVVNVSVSGSRKISTAAGAPGEDTGSGPPAPDPMRDFLLRFQQQFGGLPPQILVPIQGEGSGFIVRADGVILTNAHVVNGADEVVVKLTDQREYIAKVLGADKLSDVAVLKIDARDLPVVSVAKTQQLRAGEWVLAIGSPFGFENSVTAGVVSATRRSLPNDGSVSFIQTDVAVNPGNSGGPLINMRGEVVGINSQIYSRSGGYQGLSFAIPIDLALNIETQILERGEVRHGKLGVVVQDVNQTLAESFKLDKPAGALIADVERGSAADRAGLESGNVVVAADGKPINASGDLSAKLALAHPGDQLDLDVWQKGARHLLRVRLDDARARIAPAPAEGEPDVKGRLGMALRPLQPEEQREAGIAAGLLIERVGGVAARAGVQAGDVLLAIDSVPVSSVAEASTAVAPSEKSVAVLLLRAGRKFFIPLRLG